MTTSSPDTPRSPEEATDEGEPHTVLDGLLDGLIAATLAARADLTPESGPIRSARAIAQARVAIKRFVREAQRATPANEPLPEWVKVQIELARKKNWTTLDALFNALIYLADRLSAPTLPEPPEEQKEHVP